VGKNSTVQFEAVCGPKFMSFSHDVADPLIVVTTHLPAYVSSFVL